MSWDPSFVDPTKAPADARILTTPGGKSGPLSLENGARLSFPYKSQQEIAGTTPAYLQAVEVVNAVGPIHRQDVYVAGPTLVTGNPGPVVQLSTNYSDDIKPSVRTVEITADGSVGFTASTFQSKCQITGTLELLAAPSGASGLSVPSWITVAGSTTSDSAIHAGSTRTLTLRGGASVNMQATDSAGTIVIASGATGTVSLTAGGNASLTAGSSGTATVSAGGNATLSAGTSGTATVSSGSSGNVVLTSGTGTTNDIKLNNTNNQAVRVNGSPVVPLLNVALRGSPAAAASGSSPAPPAVTAAAPGYKIQAGVVDLTPDANSIAKITFPTAFSNGVLAMCCQGQNSDLVIALNGAAGKINKTDVEVTLYQFGVGLTAGSYVVNYIAIGW